MAYAQKIIFYKKRDFSQKINATIEFIRQNAKPLGKAILFIVGPLAILNGLLFSQYIGFVFGNMSPQHLWRCKILLVSLATHHTSVLSSYLPLARLSVLLSRSII